ncbi:hypothetical protein N0V93_005472 [Gnomoniopsis smithogilvyi]|uniref:F-box domain-containing protein n=1 Tax=Gnomoniopsis smithogilvyi TaxID=1191159 RepID=A0A9W8YSY2_9PEZI|nr:hypothetical protein N0V93_005472 [Gnomoniopsis smithogilvyi]
MTSHALAPSTPTLLGIPLELRIRIYEHLYIDLIAELSDNLFGVFSFYDHLYDYTSAYLNSHVGKTGLTTPLLYVCKQIYQEALSVLCEQAEFVVNIMGDDDSKDVERAGFRFSEGSRHLDFVRNLKINLQPALGATINDPRQTRFVARIAKFLDLIQHGANLRSLEIYLSNSINEAASMEGTLTAIKTVRTTGNSIKVYVGDVSEDILSDEHLTLLLDAINGDNMGRGHPPLEPNYYLGEEDSEVIEWETDEDI